ncbi:MAG: S8 family serine peptidase [Candidatus Krumholzibacteria bacterium]|nr:S8 family serine peptidase [Candidatus Krumholzibacteria bacterium]
MKKILFPVLIALFLGTATAGAGTFENASVVGQVPDRVIITVKAGTTLSLDKSAGTPSVGIASLDALAAKFSVNNMEPLYGDMTIKLREMMQDKSSVDVLDRVWAVDFPAEMGLNQVKAAYQALPEVEEVHLVDICKQYGGYLPNDPGINNSQWYLRNMALGGGDVRAVGAWNETLGDSNIVICILDSGVDWHHPDLGGDHPDKVTGAVWTNWTEYYGTPGLDDDGNGKTDDIRGWDFVSLSTPIPNHPLQDVLGADNDPMDYGSHGTNCAGMAAGITNNGIGVAGAAPGCKIMAVRCGYMTNDGVGVVRMDYASAGMIYAAINGANIINCSWGSTSYLNNAVTTAQNAGCLVITAAGNDNSDTDPGIGVPSYLNTRSGVLSVAATNSSDGKASFSNFGNWVELSAPGVAMYTTAYVPATDTHTYSSPQGTSFSSPLACGAAALIWSAHPTWPWSSISSALVQSCDNIDAENPAYAGLLGSGRINLQKALGDNIQQYPAEYPTLFDAINCASAEDTVKVEATAMLNGPLTIHDRGIKFFGGYDAAYIYRDLENAPTVISGNLGNAALRFQGDVDTDTEVDGFRIEGGGGVTFSGIPYFARYGGGIILTGHSPTLRNLEVTDNTVGSDSDLGCGGGIMMNNCSPVLENVSIHGNTAVHGAGLFAFESAPTLIGCDISDNIIITTHLTDQPLGGGVHILDSEFTMTDCIVSGHLELKNGGGIYVGGHNSTSTLEMTGGEISGNSVTTNGAGLYITGGTLNMTGVAIDANLKTPTAPFMHGGGIFATAATVTLDSLVVTGNGAHIGGGVDLTDCTDAVLMNSVLTGNTAVLWGGGLNFQGNAAGSISGNTFFGNDATSSGGGGIYMTTSSPAITNNISAFNTGGTSNANGMALLATPSVLSCNDTYGNTGADYSGVADPTGTDGNISLDPLFCNTGTGNFNLTTESPCTVANSGGCGLIGALTSGCGESPVPDDHAGIPAAFRVEQNFPNPFNPKTTIRFSLPAAGRTRVAIFDVAGHHVKTLIDEDLPAQAHQVVWTGEDDNGRGVAAGIYFYMVTNGADRSVGRMALVK